MRAHACFRSAAGTSDGTVIRIVASVALSLALYAGVCSDGAAAAFVSFELTYPAGQEFNRATIGASGDLKIGPDARILGENDTPGSIANAGSEAGDATSIGPGATVGAIVSIPNVIVGPKATATSATSAGIVTLGPNAKLGPVVQHAMLLPLVRKTIIAHTAGDVPPDVNLGPNGSGMLAPGQYRNVTIGPNATLQVTAGTYIVERFSLGPNAKLQLDTINGTIDVYARESASWKGTTVGDAGSLRLRFSRRGRSGADGRVPRYGNRPFRNADARPGQPARRLRRNVLRQACRDRTERHREEAADPAVRRRPRRLRRCVPLRMDLPPGEREIAYQADIARFCSAPGISKCLAYLIGRTNVDYTAAAARMIAGSFSPAEYLAVVRDRTRKLRAAEDNAAAAMLLCTAPDGDVDGVSDANDRCPNTPDLTATDDNGCPLATLPPAPSSEDVSKVLLSFHLAINPKCQDAPVPGRVPAGAFYWPAFRERGTYILSGAVLNQPPGCPVWYEFDLQEIGGPRAGERFSVVFMDREASTNLVELGRPVPEGFIQFNPRPGAVGTRDRLATIGGVAGLRYRVRAMNGNGVRGLWSDYKISDRASCTALGFQCGGG